MRVREANQVLGKIKTPDDGYRALAAAIILQACSDYSRAVSYGDKLRVQTLEHWFLSESFMAFSQGVEGGYILRKLRENGVRYEEAKVARPVRQIDENGNVVAEYSSLTEAERMARHNRRTISRSIGQGKPLNGYWWEFV